MSVFTILNHGTNSHRSRTDGEIIADFGRNMAGVEYKDFLITDGPGSKGTTSDPMPGTFDPFTKNKTSKSGTPNWSQTPMQTLRDFTGGQQQTFNPSGHGLLKKVVPQKQHSGITGDGWDDNIRRAIATLADVFPNGTGTINMIGWSRGAVTCLRMANQITDFLGQGFEFNIFAIDPVAGLNAGVELTDTYIVPKSVKNYVAVLALDEARGDFAPQDLSRIRIEAPLDTNVAFLPFPGVHNTPVMKKDVKLGEVTDVVRHLAYKFLTMHGTQFTTPERAYTTMQLCELYAAMQLKRSGYAKMMKKTIVSKSSGGIVDRGVKTDVSSYVHGDAKYFVNEHHRECLNRASPHVYSYFFTNSVPNPFGKTTTTYKSTDHWGQVFQQFSQTFPKSFDMLSASYVLEREGGFTGPAVWKASAPGVGATRIPAPPLVVGAVRTLF